VLQEQVQQERAAVDRALADVSQAERACSDVVNEASGKTRQLEDKLSAEASDWLVKAEEMKAKHDAEMQKMSQSKREEALNQKELQTVQQLAEERKREVEQLRSMMQAGNEDTLQKLADLEKQKAGIDAEARELRARTDQLETERALEKSKVDFESSRRENLQLQLETEKEAKQMILAQLETNKSLLKSDGESLYGARARLDAEKLQLQSQEDALRFRCAALDKDKEALEEERVALVEEIAQEMAAVQKEKARIESRENEVQQMQLDFQDMKDEAVNELEAREKELNDKQDEKIAELEEHVNALEERASVLSPLKDELTHADQQVEALGSQLTLVQSELDLLRSAGATELNELAGLAGSLLANLDKKQSEEAEEGNADCASRGVDNPSAAEDQPLDGSKTWRNWASKRRSSLHGDVGTEKSGETEDMSEAAFDGAESTFETAPPSSLIRSGLQGAISHLTKAPDGKGPKIEQLLSDAEDLQEQLSDAWKQLAEASQKELDLNSQLEQLQQELIQAEQRLSSCENCEQLEEMVESISQQLQSEKATSEALNSEVSQLLQAVHSAEQATTERDHDVGVLRAKLDDARARQNVPAQPTANKPQPAATKPRRKDKALTFKLFMHYASQSPGDGSFSDMDDKNAQMDLTEFVRFCRDFELTEAFSVSQLKGAFNDANRGGHADERRGMMNQSEFSVAILSILQQMAQRGKTPSKKLLELQQAITSRADEDNNDSNEADAPVANSGIVAQLEDALLQSNAANEGLSLELNHVKASHKQKLQAMYRALEEMDKKSIGDQEQMNQLQAQLDALRGNDGTDAF